MKSLPKLIVIGGPTASGKSRLARKIAREFDGEIINADSRQVYRLLSIGTAKDPIERRVHEKAVVIDGIPHHLIDFLDPSQPYNLAFFQKNAFEAIKSVHERGKIPLLVGGTGLYLDAVAHNYSMPPEKVSSLRKILRQYSLEKLQEILKRENLDTFEKLTESDQKNPHRLIRAIERARAASPVPTKNQPRYDLLYMVIRIEKSQLEKHIEDRVGVMFQKGLVEENKMLREKSYSTQLSALRTIGYEEFDAFFQKRQTREETKALIILHTLQYAKRQMTWFRRNKEAVWVSSEQEALSNVKKFLSR